MTVWIPGFPRETVAGAGGGSFTGGPYKIVLHTTEGGWASAMAVFRANALAPQIMAAPPSHPDGPRKAQFIPLDRSAFALRNEAGGVETNRDGAIQVELVGFAGEAHRWPDEDLEWIGAEIVAPIVEHAPGPIRLEHHPTFYGEGAGFVLASPSARQRMTLAQWDAFDGICGHQHVPENHHWDPGGLNIEKIVAAATGGFTMAEVAEIKTAQRRQANRVIAVVRASGKLTRSSLREVILRQEGRTRAEIEADLERLDAEDDAALEALEAGILEALEADEAGEEGDAGGG